MKRNSLILSSVLAAVALTACNGEDGINLTGSDTTTGDSSSSSSSSGGGVFDNGCVNVDDQVDEDMALRDTIVNCTNGVQTSGEGDRVPNAGDDTFQQEFFDFVDENGDFSGNSAPDGTDRVDVDNLDPNLNPDTLAANQGTAARINNPASAPGSAKGWIGAVDPTAPNPDGDPTTAGPFWDGWTYIEPANVEGSLPLSAIVDSAGLGSADGVFHPLEDEIRAGTLSPAGSPSCPSFTTSRGTATVFGTDFPVCEMNQDITSDVTLSNDHIYVMTQTINVGDGGQQGGPSGNNNAVLSIEGGTQVFAQDGSDPNVSTQASLVITRGSEIDTQPSSEPASADLPVIMGAVKFDNNSGDVTDDPANLHDRGLWGGLVLNGFGVHNACNDSDEPDEIQSEAVPTGTTRYFGCNNNSDSSGTVKYVIIAESGLPFRADEEVQGLTIEAAGSGTTIDHVQVLGSEDDGIEWFGGAASASNLVINGAEDDSLDFDGGFGGDPNDPNAVSASIQTALARQGATKGDHTIEADNEDGDGDDATPKSKPHVINATLLGNSGSDATSGLKWRRGFGGTLWRSVITDDTVAN